MVTVSLVKVAGMTTHEPDFELNRPGALIAALPAILGFTPERSLVLVSIDDGRLGAVMRVDLSVELADRLDELADVTATAGPEAAIAVVVDADGAVCPVCNEQYRDMATALTAALSRHNIDVWAAHVVDRIEAGGRWHCVDGCGMAGAVDDPSASPLAAAAVLDGRRLYARRDDLAGVIAADVDRSAALGAVLDEHVATREVAHRGDLDGRGRRDVEAVIAGAARVTAGGVLTDAEVAELACALADVQVRDTVYALAIGECAGEAETLWAMLARVLPPPWRVEALVLLAFSAYTRGDGPLAGVALEAALRDDRNHRMAQMLDTALQSGIRPEQIRELATTGYRLAGRLGVRLPSRQQHRRRAV